MRDFESTVIDVLRDTSERLDGVDSTILARWLSDPNELFRRLGLNLLTRNGALSDHEKLSKFLDGSFLFDTTVKHESFRLLASIVTSLNASDRRTLLSRVQEGPSRFDVSDELEATLHERSIFDVAEWLSRHVDDWAELDAVVEEIRMNRPTIGTRDHPDLDRFIESGSWGGTLPFGVEEFFEMIAVDGVDLSIRALLERDYSERNFDEPTWDDACSLIRQVVEEHPEVGQLFVASRAAASSLKRDDILGAAIQGWAVEHLPDDALLSILPSLQSLTSNSRLTQSIAMVCLAAVNGQITERPDAALDALDEIATELWISHANNDYDGPDSDDWTSLGLNTWPGYVAQYWLNRIRLRWRAEGPEWSGLSLAEADSIEMMLETTSAVGSPAFSIIAADVRFLFAADETFARDQIFSVFDEDLDDRAIHAWMSFLYSPRVDNVMLDYGFWDLTVRASTLAANISSRGLDSQYWRLLASLSVYSDAASVDRDDLIAYLAAHPGDLVALFVQSLVDVIADADDVIVDKAWAAWLERIMSTRLRLSIGSVSTPERTAWGDLALKLHGPMVAALTLTNNAPGPLGERTEFDEMSEETVRTNSAELTIAVTRRIRETTAMDWHARYELGQLAGKLLSAGVDRALLREMAESAMSIGLHDAARWMD